MERDKTAFHGAQDWADLERDGFYVGSKLVFPILLGIKGDWSYLVS